MNTKTFLIVLASLLFPVIYHAQPSSGKASDVFNLINEARTNPKAFLTRYKASITTYNPKLIAVLEKSSPIKKLIWDSELASNCKKEVEGNLNPKYKGRNSICGFSGGSGSGYSDREALYFVCDFYTYLFDEDYLYFGFYINNKSFSYLWGITCEPSKRYPFDSKVIVDSSKVDFKKLNTAINEAGLNAMDKEMIKELNFARQYPAVYADIISKFLEVESIKGNGLSKADYDAGTELIEELKSMSPAQLLYPKKCVYEAAKKHGIDCKNRGFSDHTGSDGSSPFDRISKACNGLEGNENLVGGSKNVRTLVIQLLIDSGINSRGHRYNMLNPKWNYVGCYGYDGGDMYKYVQNFATDK